MSGERAAEHVGGCNAACVGGEHFLHADPPDVVTRVHPMTRHHALATLGVVLVVGLLVAAVVGWVSHDIATVEIGGLTK